MKNLEGLKKGHGWNKGIPNTWSKPIVFTDEIREKMSKARLGKEPWNKGLKTGLAPWKGKKRPDISGTNNKLWKGNDVGYYALHSWLKRHLGTPKKCEYCETTEAKRFEWANISGEYRRDLTDYKSLCSKCHHKFDDITRRGWITRKGGASQFV